MLRRLFIAALVALVSVAGHAQAGLTAGQIAILRPIVLAEPTLASARQTGDDQVIAAWLNTTDPANFTVWRTSVARDTITQNVAFDWTRVDNLTVGKARIWDMMFDNAIKSINPSQVNVRAGIDAAWVGTAGDLAVRAAVYVQCKRFATRAEKALATGTGSDAVPATLTWESKVTPEEASQMR